MAPHRGQSPAERLRDVIALCALAAAQLAGRPDRDRIVHDVEPPHPSYAELVRRLRAQRAG